MEACWPSGVVLRGRAPNHRMLRWLKTVVVSDPEKAGLDPVRWGPGRRSRMRPRPGSPGSGRALFEASLGTGSASRPRGPFRPLGTESGGCPGFWPGGARRRGGVSLRPPVVGRGWMSRLWPRGAGSRVAVGDSAVAVCCPHRCVRAASAGRLSLGGSRAVASVIGLVRPRKRWERGRGIVAGAGGPSSRSGGDGSEFGAGAGRGRVEQPWD